MKVNTKKNIVIKEMQVRESAGACSRLKAISGDPGKKIPVIKKKKTERRTTLLLQDIVGSENF